MGSNGMNYMDYNLFDKKSGIYVMDAATGTIRSHFGNEVLGDMDVNGVLFYKNRIYYGNDNEEFICSSPEGKIIWRNPASGDIEHEPILLDMQGNKYVVYASEAGEVRAVDPETGKTKWVHY